MILGANSYIIKPLEISGFLKAMEGLDNSWLSFITVQD
jgi:hypothetical protein